MWGFLQRVYSRHIQEYVPPPLPPQPEQDAALEERMREAVAARRRAEQIINSLTEFKPTRPA